MLPLAWPTSPFARTILKATSEAKKPQPHQASNFTSLAEGGGKNHWGREKSLGQQAVRRALLLGTVSAGDSTARKGRGVVGRSLQPRGSVLPRGILRAKQMAKAGRSQHFSK